MDINVIHGQEKGFGATKTTYALHAYLLKNGLNSSISSYRETKSKYQKLMWVIQQLRNKPNGKFVFVQLEMIVIAIILSHFYRKTSHVYHLRNELDEIRYLPYLKRLLIISIFTFKRRRMTFVTNALFDRKWYCKPLLIINPQYLDCIIPRKRCISNNHIYHDRAGYQKNLDRLIALVTNNPSLSVTIFTSEARYNEIVDLVLNLKNVRVSKYFTDFSDVMPAGVITTSNYEGMPNFLVEICLEGGTIKYSSSSKNVRFWSVFLGGNEIMTGYSPKASYVIIYDAFDKLIEISNVNLKKIFL
jgi:hypothetical protein